MLAAAYAEQRIFELRLPDARYVPVKAQPGGDTSVFSRPVALLDAESRISRQLAKNPDDVPWLRLRARAEMLDQNYDDAISTLNRATDAQPDNPDLLADLGVVYALRAEAANRDVDYGYAIEYLGRSLKAKPNSQEAVFNRAVIFERIYLYDDGVREWRRYLDMDTAGPWRQEAQHRLIVLEQKKKVRQAALARISNDPELLLRRIEEGEDVEPESYLDVAVVEWLPRRWESAQYERALGALATRFEARHRDRWLRDMLAAPRSEPLAKGLTALSAAAQANLADESERALAKATEAVTDLRAAGNESGVLRGEFEQAYALHRALRHAECLQKSTALERKAAAMSYSWILGQTLLEEGICRGSQVDSGGAYREMVRALAQIRQAGYRDLELRGAGILSGTQTELGNLLAAWDLSRTALATYWDGPYPGIRAQQIYFNLERSAKNLGLFQAAYVFSGAAALALAGTPRRRSEAWSTAHSASLAVALSWTEDAQKEYGKAARLFDQLEQTKTNRNYRTYAELEHAEAEVGPGTANAALERLRSIRFETQDIGAATVRIRFQQALGGALWHSGRRQAAEPAFRSAIELNEQQLSTLKRPEERAGLMRAAGKAYRGLVQLYWDRGDIAGALRLWEWFQAGAVPGRRGELDLSRGLSGLRNESFLSYAILPAGIVAWVFDDRGIEGRQLTVKPEALELVASRFLRQCADPGSSRDVLERDARQLYDWLVAPLSDRLDPARTLVIEPDGAVGAIPLQALMNQNFRYLGERFGIIVAGGLTDYQQRAEGGPVTAGKALVVADPALGKETSRAFPPLSETTREGGMIAARLRGSVLLTRERATLAALEQHLPDTELFHFAGHGFSNAGNGGLMLAAEQSNPSGAEVLDAKRLAQQDWSRCRLAVLSACSTGTGETRGPVNPESLVRALLSAGVARVVATRWNVDSETGVLLMDRFYTALLSRVDVGTALQRAARSVRENHNTSHPYFWAGFQSFGTR